MKCTKCETCWEGLPGLIIPKLTFGFAFAFDGRHSVACADEDAAQIRPLPLFINAIEAAILYATI